MEGCCLAPIRSIVDLKSTALIISNFWFFKQITLIVRWNSLVIVYIYDKRCLYIFVIQVTCCSSELQIIDQFSEELLKFGKFLLIAFQGWMRLINWLNKYFSQINMEFQAQFVETETSKCSKILEYSDSDRNSVTELLKTFQKESNEFLTQCIDNAECLPAEGMVVSVVLFSPVLTVNFSLAEEDEIISESDEDETSLPERPNKLIKMS